MDWSTLKGLDLIICSEEDINYDWNSIDHMKSYVDHLVVTRAEKGCEVYIKDKREQFPAYSVKDPVDFTGAGDVFAFTYILAYASTKDYSFAARFANCAASICIERKGIEHLPTLSAIKARMFKA